MVQKFIFFFFLVIFLLSNSYAQKIEHLVPIGFNNPFLKSGQFISSMFLENSSFKSEYEDKTGIKRNEYYLSFQTYLGLTDDVTLSTRLNTFPTQTVDKGLFDGGGDRKQNFNIRPEFILSYRPSESVEIFGLVDYSNYESSFKESSFKTVIPVGVDEFGNTIYEERTMTIQPRADLKNTFSNIKIGVTFSGKLW